MIEESLASPLLDASKTHRSADLLAYFDSLDAIPEEFMLGEWHGEILPTGHVDESVLLGFDWIGKRFHSPDKVDPLVCIDDNGARVVNPVLGGACLREMVFRGKCTATMVYDKHPISDHFVKLDDNCVLGVMDRKGRDGYLFFLLTRILDE